MGAERAIWASLLGLAVAVVGLVAAPEPASACGGFFCNNQQPVRQSFERIVFSQNEDDTVTAVIQIQYQGPSEQFAWLLPVPGEPKVGVSSNSALTRLENATAPSYQMETTVEGNCEDPSSGGLFGGGGTASTAANDSAGTPEQDRGVEVIDGGTVGPYRYETISVSESAEDPAREALDWLEENNYDLSDLGPGLIREYLNDDMNLLAFKLTKNAEAGEIRPVKVTYEWPQAMIPIKLTAVAAQSDMGVLVWLAGPNRGIPTKYNALELNEARINWFRWRANYDDLVTEAADEAGGQGFVTEYADETSTVEDVIFTEDDESTWQNFAGSDWQGSEGELLFSAINQYAQWNGLPRAVSQGLELPEDVSAQEVVNDPALYYERSASDIEGMQPQEFISALEEHVVGPMRGTEELVQSRPYLTRLYTTMSANEMTKDPVFDFNPDLGDVSNTHTARRTVYCSNRVTRAEAPWNAELPDGTVVHGTGNQWPFASNRRGNRNSGSESDDEMPAAEVVKETSMTGEGEVVEDNSESIQQTIRNHNDDISLDPGGCSCSTSGDGFRPSPIGWLMAAGLGLVAVRRLRD
jgi:MYXO-CTERM domain-containing protein